MITENVKNIINELPRGVLLEAAAKTRTEEEIDQAIIPYSTSPTSTVE